MTYEKKSLYFNEINALPGLWPFTSLPHNIMHFKSALLFTNSIILSIPLFSDSNLPTIIIFFIISGEFLIFSNNWISESVQIAIFLPDP